MTAEDAQEDKRNDFLHKLQSWQMRHKHQQNCSSLQPLPRREKKNYLIAITAKTRATKATEKTTSFFLLH